MWSTHDVSMKLVASFLRCSLDDGTIETFTATNTANGQYSNGTAWYTTIARSTAFSRMEIVLAENDSNDFSNETLQNFSVGIPIQLHREDQHWALNLTGLKNLVDLKIVTSARHHDEEIKIIVPDGLESLDLYIYIRKKRLVIRTDIHSARWDLRTLSHLRRLRIRPRQQVLKPILNQILMQT